MDDVYVKSLEPRDAQTVFNWWPYNPSTTVDDVADELARLPSAGVFLKSSNKLVSCMNLHPPNGMSRLFTLEEHRRKGYADLLTRYLSKRVAQAGHSPYVHITEGNTVSEQFFHHMGFRLQRPGYIHTTLH
jgi:predicted GNAT family acetyltransferase